MKGNGLELHQGRFSFNSMIFFFHGKGCKTLEQTVQRSGGSPSLEVFKTCVDMKLEDMV